MSRNLHERTVAAFGDEWTRFDQSALPDEEAVKVFEEYFAYFPWEALPDGSEGFDMGCGTGRWARFVAQRVGTLHCVDPSDAVEIARRHLVGHANVHFHRASVEHSGLAPGSQDFGYSLGVLHHVPDTAAAIRSCVALLKPGAPLLLYLYYAFDNRPSWFRVLWRISDILRRVVYRLPAPMRHVVTDAIAVSVYWPLARLARALHEAGVSVDSLPLAYYRDHSLYTMRTDARDRFGTPLEQRFTRESIRAMMYDAGLVDIRVSDRPPYWCAVGVKA